MKRISKLALAITSTMVCLLANAGVPNHEDPTPFLGPTLEMSHTSYLNACYAYSFLGELGFRHVRGSATLGWNIDNIQRVKGTVEILSQKLGFGFTSGDVEEWVTQGALGADYVYALNWFNNLALDVDGFFAYSTSKNLRTRYGFYRNLQGGIVDFVNYRHIAGARAFGVGPGIILNPWIGSTASLRLNYDNVHYRTRFRNNNHDGFGGTVKLTQLISDNVDITLLAGLRHPFNNYLIDLGWNNLSYMGRWNLGMYGEYVNGRYDLVNSWNIGFRADYFFDPEVTVDTKKGKVQARASDPFVNWVGEPAVRMPQVLVVTDQLYSSICRFGNIALLGEIPSGSTAIGTTDTRNLNLFFSGTNVSYTVTVSPITTGLTVTTSIAGGVLSIRGTDPTLTFPNVASAFITVTANNGCATTSSTFVEEFFVND